MSFPIPGNSTYPLHKSINTFSFYIYMCRWHNLHKHTHAHTELQNWKKKFPQQQADIFYQNSPRDKCAEITHFQGFSAPVEWLPNIPVSLVTFTVQSHQPKPTSFSCIWPKSSHAASPQFFPWISKALVCKSTTYTDHNLYFWHFWFSYSVLTKQSMQSACTFQ